MKPFSFFRSIIPVCSLKCLALIASLILLLPAIGSAGSVLLMVTNVDATIGRVKFLTAPTNAVPKWTTNSFSITNSVGSVTNLITGLPAGPTWATCYYIGTNGVAGGLSTNVIQFTVPPDAGEPVIVPFSMLLDDGGTMLIARDIKGPYRERFSARIVRAPITAASVSTPPPDQIAVTWAHYADDPQQFAMSAGAYLQMKAAARPKPAVP